MPNDPAFRPEPLTIVGTRGSRRVRAVCDAARECGLAEIEVVSYADAVNGVWRPPPGSLVRCESPSECPQTLRLLLKKGEAPLAAEAGDPLAASEIDRLSLARGEMPPTRQWFLGFRMVLSALAEQWREQRVRWMSSPATLALAFDKVACLELWAARGLPTPPRYPSLCSYAEIRARIPQRHARLFVKLRYGYSAMGAVALEWRDHLVRAITTVEVAGPCSRPTFYVTKRPRVLLQEAEIAWLIDALAREQLVVEAWTPKARWNGLPYDLRLVVVGGRARHWVGRANASPFTNLNLDATRIPQDELEASFGDDGTRLTAMAEAAAACFPDALSLGLDILVRPRRSEFLLLEANAFGDYLPGLTHRGESTYAAQFRAVQNLPPGAAA